MTPKLDRAHRLVLIKFENDPRYQVKSADGRFLSKKTKELLSARLPPKPGR